MINALNAGTALVEISAIVDGESYSTIASITVLPATKTFDNEEIFIDLSEKTYNIDYSEYQINDVVLGAYIESDGWKTMPHETPVSFIKELQENRPDVIFLDLMMPNINGFQVIQYLKKNKINIPVVVITALSQKEIIARAKEYGVSHILTKPLQMNVILDTAKDALGIS